VFADEVFVGKNLALQNELIALRAATASAYSTAQHLKDRWKEIEQKQAGLYSVSLGLPLDPASSDRDTPLYQTLTLSFPRTEIPPILPPSPSTPRHIRSRRSDGIPCDELYRVGALDERHARTITDG
jgi:hypothetical protein